MELNPTTKSRISELAKLKQKKFRLEKRQVIVEGERLISQLLEYGVHPIELYQALESEISVPANTPIVSLSGDQFARICDSENPPQIAALMPLPVERKTGFRRALCLNSISDPGNMGTIFRLAAAFAIDAILLYGENCEISNPKVIRSSLGAVYKVPFQTISLAEFKACEAQKIGLSMEAKLCLADFSPPEKSAIYILGSEAHGISPELIASIDTWLQIPMPGQMESLNVAIAAGILCYSLSLG